MAMKTILVPTENHAAMRSALETALLLARQCDSYIEGFALQFGINEFSAIDMGGGLSLETFKQESQEDAAQARKLFETFMEENKVPRSNGITSSLSFGWMPDAPEGENFVGSYGRVFDVIVLSRPDGNTTGLHNKAVESGLFDSGRPILVAPPKATSKIGTNVLIAWNRSTEQARTVALAMPLLHRAERVTVLTVTGGNEVPGPSSDQCLQYLHRNEIDAKGMTVELNGRNTGEAVLTAAVSVGCDLLIKGAYTQSRLRQMIFGGTTRHILANSTLPVMLAH